MCSVIMHFYQILYFIFYTLAYYFIIISLFYEWYTILLYRFKMIMFPSNSYSVVLLILIHPYSVLDFSIYLGLSFLFSEHYSWGPDCSLEVPWCQRRPWCIAGRGETLSTGLSSPGLCTVWAVSDKGQVLRTENHQCHLLGLRRPALLFAVWFSPPVTP